jgi:hypothetical protein
MMTTAKLLPLACALLIALSVPAAAQDFTWFINDGPDGAYAWTDLGLGTFWEAMAADAIEPGDVDCRVADLPLPPEVTAYWACTAPLSFDFANYGFWADLYLSNNYEAHSNPVFATLGRGTCGQEQSFTAIAGPVQVDLTYFDPEMDCGLAYRFDFGVIGSLALTNESLILKIEYAGQPNDGHIYWDGECCPSALACEEGTAAATASFSLVKALY